MSLCLQTVPCMDQKWFSEFLHLCSFIFIVQEKHNALKSHNLPLFSLILCVPCISKVWISVDGKLVTSNSNTYNENDNNLVCPSEVMITSQNWELLSAPSYHSLCLSLKFSGDDKKMMLMDCLISFTFSCGLVAHSLQQGILTTIKRWRVAFILLVHSNFVRLLCVVMGILVFWIGDLLVVAIRYSAHYLYFGLGILGCI